MLHPSLDAHKSRGEIAEGSGVALSAFRIDVMPWHLLILMHGHREVTPDQDIIRSILTRATKDDPHRLGRGGVVLRAGVGVAVR
jgi:hypothetical protein